MNPRRLLSRHLSFANVVACLALFAALGGSAYAGSRINGNRIVKHTIGANKLKNRTITSKQIKKGSLNSSVIDVSTLATVPSAQSAVTAQSASSADSANHASTADSATTADSAARAAAAQTAAKATSAEHAASAAAAATAGHADTAGDASTVGGRTAAALTDACPADTTLFGGMCWDDSPQPSASWINAAEDCGERGGRLPTVSELVAYVLQDGIQFSGHVWSSDVADASMSEELVVTSDETDRGASSPGSPHGYRCLFYRTNAG